MLVTYMLPSKRLFKLSSQKQCRQWNDYIITSLSIMDRLYASEYYWISSIGDTTIISLSSRYITFQGDYFHTNCRWSILCLPWHDSLSTKYTNFIHILSPKLWLVYADYQCMHLLLYFFVLFIVLCEVAWNIFFLNRRSSVL